MAGILFRLIGRLSVSRKLLLIYLLDLSAVIFITSILIEEKFIAIDFARKEMVGSAYIANVRDALFGIVHSHDGQPAGDFRAMESRLETLDDRYAGDVASRAAADDFRQALLALGAMSPGSDANRLHHQAFKAGRKLVSRIGDQSNLILDPDLDSYYTMSLTLLRFPEVLDLLLHLPDSGRDDADGQMRVLEGQLTALLGDIESDYQAAYAGNPGHTLQARLEPTRITLVGALRALLPDNPRRQEELATLRQQAIAATAEAWQATANALDTLLVARVELFFQRMWMHLGMAAALLLVILLLVFYIARQIALPLHRLAGVAHQVQADNDYSLRASWQSEDEIGRLVSGFNSMLERLNHDRVIQQELAAQARAAEAQRELLEAIPIPLLVTAVPDHRVLHANAPVQAWTTQKQDDPWADSLDSSTRARFFQRLADEGEVHEFEVRWRGPLGVSWALLSASRLKYQGLDSILSTFSPINQLKRLEARLKIWATVFEASSEGILVFDQDSRILLANAAIARATGFRVDDLVGQEAEFLGSPRHDQEAIRGIKQAVAEQGAWQGEFWIRRKNGSEAPQWLALNTVLDDSGERSHTIALFVDISERKANEERISHLAHHDALTGLPNRLLFDERLRMSLQQVARHGERGALLFIDLDRFKNINDSLGHNVGDGLLQSVASRLLETVRAGDTVCRQGGDEFVVILNGVADESEVAHLIENRLIQQILKTHSVCGVELHISCSVGVAIFPDDGDEIDTLMRNADAAMYAAKANGRNNFQFFSAEMNRHAVERIHTENNLRHALERQEFELHLQPIVSLSSGDLVAAEALIRWRHPAMGLVPPAKFIQIAEQTGQILQIGQWVIEEASRLHMQYLAAGLGPIPIAVNVSAVQFQRGGFAELVAATLVKSGMAPACLQLELTETLVMTRTEQALEELRKLKAIGIVLSLDDFGTGYSSLSYLHRFPFDKIKIDRSFVRDMIEDPADLVITRSIISLGHSLGLRVVAEGVEHVEELKLLHAAGCEEIQGYLFSRPVPGIEFANWLAEWRGSRNREVAACARDNNWNALGSSQRQWT